MGELAERIILKEVREESRIKQEEIALRNKIAQEKIHETNILALRLFSSYGYVDKEWFWNFIAYTYFTCRTLGLLILINLFIFGRTNTILFTSIFLYFCYLNLKLYRYISRKKTKDNI